MKRCWLGIPLFCLNDRANTQVLELFLVEWVSRIIDKVELMNRATFWLGFSTHLHYLTTWQSWKSVSVFECSLLTNQPIIQGDPWNLGARLMLYDQCWEWTSDLIDKDKNKTINLTTANNSILVTQCIVLFWFGEWTASIWHNMFFPISITLWQDSSNSIIIGICVQNKWLLKVWIAENWRSGQLLMQGFKADILLFMNMNSFLTAYGGVLLLMQNYKLIIVNSFPIQETVGPLSQKMVQAMSSL